MPARFPKNIAILFLFAIVSLIYACGDVEPESMRLDVSNDCESGQAKVGIHDLYMEIYCGCSEPAGSTSNSGSRMHCSIPTGTNITMFIFSHKTPHLIRSVGTNVIPTSPPVYPNETGISSIGHGFTLDQPGNYDFDDEFNSTLSGRFRVF